MSNLTYSIAPSLEHPKLAKLASLAYLEEAYPVVFAISNAVAHNAATLRKYVSITCLNVSSLTKSANRCSILKERTSHA